MHFKLYLFSRSTPQPITILGSVFYFFIAEFCRVEIRTSNLTKRLRNLQYDIEYGTSAIWLRGYKTFFILSSTEHFILTASNIKTKLLKSKDFSCLRFLCGSVHLSNHAMTSLLSYLPIMITVSIPILQRI